MILVDLLLISALIISAYIGAKRGFILVSLELASFIIASAIALAIFHPVGTSIKNLAGLPVSLSNIVGFVLVWVVAEIAGALVIRFTVLPHLHRLRQPSPVTGQIAGAALNIIKTVIIITLGLIIFSALPFSSGLKRAITESALTRPLLTISGKLQGGLSTGLRHDLSESLNFFTVTAEPESQQRIELGFTTSGTISPKDEQAMLTLLNNERTNQGLAPLTMNPKAQNVARAYSTDMFARGYFSHISPEGRNPFDRMRAGQVVFGAAGENLALAPTLQLAHQGLMNSPGHRANLLKANYRTVGIGIVDGGSYGLMVTQDFTD